MPTDNNSDDHWHASSDPVCFLISVVWSSVPIKKVLSRRATYIFDFSSESRGVLVGFVRRARSCHLVFLVKARTRQKGSQEAEKERPRRKIKGTKVRSPVGKNVPDARFDMKEASPRWRKRERGSETRARTVGREAFDGGSLCTGPDGEAVINNSLRGERERVEIRQKNE